VTGVSEVAKLERGKSGGIVLIVRGKMSWGMSVSLQSF